MAGVVEYRLTDETMAVLHVEVTPDLRGKGVSDAFYADVMELVRERELLVRPICGWARRQMRARPEYLDLLAET